MLENSEPPSHDVLTNELVDISTDTPLKSHQVYEQQLKDLSDQDDSDLFRKRLLLDKNFGDLVEFMLEDTIFNVMEEATFEEFDLIKPPKTYIHKD
jgi:hypothetical protein